MITIIRPGFLTLVEDGGRWGWQHLGVPVSGPMDAFSFRLANRLVGNADGEAALEITMKGPEVRFDGAAVVAVAGADLSPRVAGGAFPLNEPVSVLPSQVMTFGERRSGARAYLAVRGGLDVPAVLGSRATSIHAGLPGLAGRAVRAGDVLPVGARGYRPIQGRVALEGVRDNRSPVVLRVVPGPDDGLFPPSVMQAFLSSAYRVLPQSNRMGYRLEGPRLSVRGGGQLLSEASPSGSVQVPPSGDPILLMADHQTTGGYARIGTVIAADLSIAGQLAPGDPVRFEACSLDAAIEALRRQQVLLEHLVRTS